MKQKEKTVKQWLDTLSEPYKTKALNNLFKETKNEKVESLILALYRAFFWEDTREGDEYWRDLAKSLEK